MRFPKSIRSRVPRDREDARYLLSGTIRRVCIDRAYRRRGALRGLYEAQKQDLAGRFDVGVAFVSRSNPHSLAAHIAGLGMTEVGDFELLGNVYVILPFDYHRNRLPKGVVAFPDRRSLQI